MKKLFISFSIMLLAPVITLAWEGYDYETGNYVEIEKGNLVREGEEIEYYDLVSHKFLKKRQVHLSCIATKKQENSRAYKPVAALF